MVASQRQIQNPHVSKTEACDARPARGALRTEDQGENQVSPAKDRSVSLARSALILASSFKKYFNIREPVRASVHPGVGREPHPLRLWFTNMCSFCFFPIV